jgi:hypothetical protein
MKTLRTLFVISSIVLASGYTKANNGPKDPAEIKNSVRETIATALESSDIDAKGQVVVKFSVDDKSQLNVLKVESRDQKLNQQVKDALTNNEIDLPKGAKGKYQIKMVVNKGMTNYKYGLVRENVIKSVKGIQTPNSGSVDLKIRVVNPSYVKVLKAESKNKELAQIVKEKLESGNFSVPQNLNGEYNIKVSVK